MKYDITKPVSPKMPKLGKGLISHFCVEFSGNKGQLGLLAEAICRDTPCERLFLMLFLYARLVRLSSTP